jgi:putative Mg2+ transporter-C (MgtC) family protein
MDLIFTEEHLTSVLRLVIAVVAGGLIGLERSYNGRPAGFRTHALVCMSSSLLMLLTVNQWALLNEAPIETIRVDPTRMAQGIMTGIGFLGAGVIMRERYTIRGLTTAASIWITAAIGILIGMGDYLPAAWATLFSLGTLSLFRWLESKLPSLEFAKLSVKSLKKDDLIEEDLIEILTHHQIRSTSRSYHLEDERKLLHYEMTILARHTQQFKKLADTLSQMEEIQEFSVEPRSS